MPIVRLKLIGSSTVFTVFGYFTSRAVTISSTQIVPAITYSHFQENPAARSAATMAGPMIAPTPKNPSTVFMVVVCSEVEREISPISARAPVLKMPIAAPEMTSSVTKEQKGVSHRKQIGVQREEDEPKNDGLLAAELVRQIPEENSRQRNRRHGGIVEGPGGSIAQIEFFDDLRDDFADRIGGHGKHHEHQKREPLDGGQIVLGC